MSQMSDRCVQLDGNRSWSEGNNGDEIKDIRSILSSSQMFGIADQRL